MDEPIWKAIIIVLTCVGAFAVVEPILHCLRTKKTVKDYHEARAYDAELQAKRDEKIRQATTPEEESDARAEYNQARIYAPYKDGRRLATYLDAPIGHILPGLQAESALPKIQRSLRWKVPIALCPTLGSILALIVL